MLVWSGRSQVQILARDDFFKLIMKFRSLLTSLGLSCSSLADAMLQCAAIGKVYKIITKQAFDRISVYKASLTQITVEIGFLRDRIPAIKETWFLFQDTILL